MLRSALSSRTLKAAAVVGAGAVSTQREKLSIYPEPEPQLVLIDTPSALENQIGEVRTHLTHACSDGYARVQGIVSRWIGIEEAVEARIKALHAPDEPLTPSALYVAVGTLAGSIIASSRGLPTRLVLPSIFFLASAQHFLPKTSHNVGEYLGSLEDTYAPRLAQTHETAKAHTAMTVARAGEALKGAREAFGEGVGHALRVAEDRTGVKIAQAVRWGERTEAAVERKVAEVKADAGKEVQAGEAKLRARAEEIVRGVREAAERAEKEAVRVVKQAGADVAAAAPSVDAAAAVDAVERKEEDVKEGAKRGLDEAKGEAKRVVEETVKASTPVEDKPAPRKRLV